MADGDWDGQGDVCPGGGFTFIVQDGRIIKLEEGDLEVACMKDRMSEDMSESQADSYVDKILTINMEMSSITSL